MRKISRLLLAATTVLSALVLTPKAADARPVDLRRARVTDSGVYAAVSPGSQEVKLTLDPKLQRAVDRILARAGVHEGAIVVSDVRTGRILAWVTRGDRDYVSEPFAPSASLFKLVTASALLEGGRVNGGTRECFDGGEHAVTSDELDRRGSFCTTFGEALGHSYNLVFAKLAKKHLKSQDLRRFAGDLGFAGEAPIDVPVGASTARIPDDPFGMARASAGFWNGELSPLGGLFAVQTIANDGERIRLSLVDRGSNAGRVSLGRAMSVNTAKALTHMMEVTTRRGTAAKAFHRPDGSAYLPNVTVAAKTGTLIGGSPTRMFSWFAGFAPSTKPEIAVTVMLGNDLRWHTKANIVGREVLEAHFHPEAAAPSMSGRVASRSHGSRKR